MGQHEQHDTPREHWDREQWAPDAPEALEPDATDNDEVWNRQQMEFDNTGTEREGLGREALPGDMAGAADRGEPDLEHISGRGMPSGESHWGRTDRDDRTEG